MTLTLSLQAKPITIILYQFQRSRIYVSSAGYVAFKFSHFFEWLCVHCTVHTWTAESWMIYREPGFLAVVWFCSSTPSTVRKLDRRNAGRERKRDNLLRGVGGRGEEPNHKTARKLGPQQIINTLCCAERSTIMYLIGEIKYTTLGNYILTYWSSMYLYYIRKNQKYHNTV